MLTANAEQAEWEAGAGCGVEEREESQSVYSRRAQLLGALRQEIYFADERAAVAPFARLNISEGSHSCRRDPPGKCVLSHPSAWGVGSGYAAACKFLRCPVFEPVSRRNLAHRVLQGNLILSKIPRTLPDLRVCSFTVLCWLFIQHQEEILGRTFRHRVLAGMELAVFVPAHMVLCLRFLTKSALVTHRCFSYH